MRLYDQIQFQLYFYSLYDKNHQNATSALSIFDGGGGHLSKNDRNQLCQIVHLFICILHYYMKER